MKVFFATLLLSSTLAFAGAKKVAKAAAPRAFVSVSVQSLRVVETREDEAVVEGNAGEITLVRAGDLLGSEGFTVERVGKGCVFVKAKGGRFSLCSEAPAVPQS